MARKRQKWDIGDLFKVPLPDGRAVLGHIVGREPAVLNSVTCAFFDTVVPASCPPDSSPAPDMSRLISCVFTTKDLLANGTWPVIGTCEPDVPANCLPFEDKRADGWVGAKMYGSGIVAEFLQAYYGLVPWDDFADPDYLDALLLDPLKKPHVVYKRDL